MKKMIPLVLLWVATATALSCSGLAIIWSIYAVYNKCRKKNVDGPISSARKLLDLIKIKLPPTSKNSIEDTNKQTNTGNILTENSAILPEYEGSKMDYKSRMEEIVHIKAFYSIDSCTDTSSSSDEEDLTSSAVLTRDVIEETKSKISPQTPPRTPPKSPPQTPPKTPPQTPPKTPPQTPPQTPPKTPPRTPPKTPPKTPPIVAGSP